MTTKKTTTGKTTKAHATKAAGHSKTVRASDKKLSQNEAAVRVLAQWRTQRDDLQAELDNAEEATPATYDADAILAELDELEQHLTGNRCPWRRRRSSGCSSGLRSTGRRSAPAAASSCGRRSRHASRFA